MHYLKKFMMALLLASGCQLIQAQVQVSPNVYFVMNSTPIPAEDIAELKTKKTIFICYSTDNISQLKKELSSVWKINELVFVTESDFNEGKFEEGNAIFVPYTLTSDYNQYYYYQLSIPAKPNNKVFGFFLVQGKEFSAKPVNYGPFVNWSITNLKANLKLMNDCLENNRNIPIWNEALTSEVGKLSQSTLLIPEEYVNKSALSALKKYPYPYEIVPMETAEAKLAKADKKYYLLACVQGGGANHFSVIDPATSAFIYTDRVVILKLGKIFGKSEVTELVKTIKMQAPPVTK